MMGFGLMGAGAAVSGLMGGYQQGRKFAQDEERFGMEKERFGLEKEEAGQRKLLRDEQIKGAGLANKAAERQNRLNDEEDDDIAQSRNIVRDFYASFAEPAGVTDPASTPTIPAAPSHSGTSEVQATPDGSEVSIPRSAGISPPPQAAAPRAPAQPSGPSLTDFQGLYDKLTGVGLNRILRTQGPAAAVQQMIEMGKRFKDIRVDAAIDALRSFDGTNGDQINAALAQAGRKPPEGTRYEKQAIEPFPGSGYKTEDVVAIGPDGKVLARLHGPNGLLASRLTPEQIIRREDEVGKAAAEYALRKSAEDNLERYRKGELELRGKTLDEQIRHHGAMETARRTEIGYLKEGREDANKAKALAALERASGDALKQILQLQGVSREVSAKDLDMLPPGDKQRIQRALAKGLTAHTIWSMNRKLDGTEGITASESLGVMSAPKEEVKRDDDGSAYILLGKKKILVPNQLLPKAPAPGIKPPSIYASPEEWKAYRESQQAAPQR